MFRSRSFRSLAIALALLSPALSQSLTGRVVSPNLTPIAGIVVDAGSGSTPATTDALGFFTITPLQLGNTYAVEFVPPFGIAWAARIVPAAINGAVNLGDVVLQPAFPISGIARTAAGLPILGCNINVYDQAGTKQFTPRDGTDLLGAFQVFVPAGTWDLRVVPPTGSLLVPKQIENIVLNAAVGLGNVVLPDAYLVTGAVVDRNTAVPVAGTRIKAYNALTGERIYVPNDQVNTFGQFSLPLPYGIADLELEPPVGNTHVARTVYGVLVGGPLALGQVRLENGALLSGAVTANGTPVTGCDIDVLLADGSKIFTPRDKTAAVSGTFTVAIPTGVPLRVRCEPVNSTGLAGVVTAAFTANGPTNLGAIALPGGFVVSGTVQGPNGPEFDTELRFFDAVSNVETTLVGARTNAAGNYTTWVPAGSYRVEIHSAEASFARAGQQLLTVSGPTSFSPVLGGKLLRCGLTSFGTPTLPQGSLLPINVFLHSLAPGLQPVLVDLLVRLPNGTELLILPGLPLALPPIPFTVDFVWVPVPVIPTTELGKVIEMVVRLRSGNGATVLDEAATPFVVE
jgi:hypothetical protein